jgi:hypothetical protein
MFEALLDPLAANGVAIEQVEEEQRGEEQDEVERHGGPQNFSGRSIAYMR